jgi:hypothetical protein
VRVSRAMVRSLASLLASRCQTMTPLATVTVWRRDPCPVEVDVVPPQRERFGSSQAGGGDEEPQRVEPVAAGAAVVEEGDELLAGPAVVADVA